MIHNLSKERLARNEGRFIGVNTKLGSFLVLKGKSSVRYKYLILIKFSYTRLQYFTLVLYYNDNNNNKQWLDINHVSFV